MPANNAFDRDFGYLMPFLDKLEAHARGLSDAAARDELLGLLSGEKERFTRIRGLLGGAAPTSTSSPAAQPMQPAKPAFTVGNLTSRKRP
ncbi:MAG: hypothetical protein AB2A00_00725 [Myxococcota bacterium]